MNAHKIFESSMISELASSKKHIAELKTELDETKTELNETRQKHTAEIERITKDSAESEKKLEASYQNTCDYYIDVNAKLHAISENLMTRSRKELLEVQKELSDTKEQFLSTQKELTSAREQLAAMTEKHTADIAKLKKEADDTADALWGNNEHTQMLSRRAVAAVKKELADAREQLVRLNEQLTAETTGLKEQLAQAGAILNSTLTELANTKTTLSGTQESLIVANGELARLRECNENLHTTVSGLTARVNTYEYHMKDLLSDLT